MAKIKRFLRIHFLLFPKNKIPLSQVIESRKQDHSCQHRYIFLDLLCFVCQDRLDCRLSDPICQQIAHRYVSGESQCALSDLPPMPERKLLVEYITEYAPDNVIRRRRYPVGAAYQIVQPEHDGGAYQGVEDTDQDEFQEFFVDDIFQLFILHFPTIV